MKYLLVEHLSLCITLLSSVIIVYFEGPASQLSSSFCRVQFFVGSDALESYLLVALFGKYFIGKPLMHFPEKRWSLRIVLF